MSQKTIIICCDGTGSMRTYFRAIKNVLPQVITMLMPLYGKEINVFLSVYHDYDNKSPNNERGGYSISDSGNVDDCLEFINKSLTKVSSTIEIINIIINTIIGFSVDSTQTCSQDTFGNKNICTSPIETTRMMISYQNI